MTRLSFQPRTLRDLSVLCLALSVLLLTAVDLKAQNRVDHQSKTKGELYHNEDATAFFGSQNILEGKAGEIIDRYVDVMADAGVTTFVCNTNDRGTNYRSDVWDAHWDGYDPEGPDDQPFLAPIDPGDVKFFRKWFDNMLAVHKQGIDYPARVIERCRYRGISPWITLRMNDCHFNNIPDHPFHGTFWKNHPEFVRKNCKGYFATCLDYAHPEVRDYYMALIVETLDRYDIDGLELDFMREPYLFSANKEAEGAPILTEWVRQVRKKVDAAAAKRGHPIGLGVRAPSRPETASKMGIEAVEWAKEGLIDVLVVTPRWATLEFDMPMEKWRQLLGDSKTKLLGGLEVLYRPCPGWRGASMATPELARGAAIGVLSRGADAVYLFNYFQNSWYPDSYQKNLRPMRSLDSLLKLPYRVGVTNSDITAPGEVYKSPLPATGRELVFPIRLGPLTEKSGDCELLIGLLTSKEAPAPIPTATVNGNKCKILSDEITSDTAAKIELRTITFSVPLSALKQDEAQEVKITVEGEKPMTVRQVEMALGTPKP